MIIGVPKEIKANENRVALLPVGVSTLKQSGHTVLVQANAGLGSGFDDESYRKAGAEIISSPKEIYGPADMIMKVKEPIAIEYNLVREGQIVFTYFHFAASKELAEAMMKAKIVAVAYETVQKADGSLPLLIPMSEVAGRMAPQEGAKYLEADDGRSRRSTWRRSRCRTCRCRHHWWRHCRHECSKDCSRTWCASDNSRQ